MRELCGFFEVFGGRAASSGYEVLGASKITKKSSAPKRGSGISRPALVREGAQAHKAIVKALIKIQQKNPHVTKFKTMVHGEHGNHAIVFFGDNLGAPLITKKLTPKQKKALDRYNAMAQHAQKKADEAGKALAAAAQKTIALKKVIGKSAVSHVALQHKKISMRGEDGSAAEDQAIDDVANTPPAPVVPIDTAVHHVNDGIVYDGTKGWPTYGFGSKKFFDGFSGAPGTRGGQDNWGDVYGYVWGFDRVGAPESPLPVRWFRIYGWNDSITGKIVNWDDLSKIGGSAFKADEVAYVSQRSLEDTDKGGPYGPLIGNPNSDFKNLRWAIEDKKWFWFPEEAPEWATAEIQREAQLKQKAIDDAAKAAAAAEKAAKDKEAAEQAAEQARQEFQQALAEKAAESEARIEETKRASEQAKYDIEAGRQEQEQSMAERKAALEAEIEERKAALEERRAAIARQQAQPQYDEGAPGYPTPEPQGYGESDAPPPYAPSGGWDTSLTPGPMPGEGSDDPFAQGGGEE